MLNLDWGYSLGSILIGALLAAAAIAVAFGPELLYGVQRRRRDPATLDQPISASVVERKSAAL